MCPPPSQESFLRLPQNTEKAPPLPIRRYGCDPLPPARHLHRSTTVNPTRRPLRSRQDATVEQARLSRSRRARGTPASACVRCRIARSEEHTSELQSPVHLVC